MSVDFRRFSSIAPLSGGEKIAKSNKQNRANIRVRQEAVNSGMEKQSIKRGPKRMTEKQLALIAGMLRWPAAPRAR
jgi:hypothetical protein